MQPSKDDCDSDDDDDNDNRGKLKKKSFKSGKNRNDDDDDVRAFRSKWAFDVINNNLACHNIQLIHLNIQSLLCVC